MINNQLKDTDISYLDSILTLPHTKPVHHDVLKTIPQNDLSLWCLKNGYYQLPSYQLIHFLRNIIDDWGIVQNVAIEIGAGNGCIGHNLGIPITDNCLQQRPDMALHYAMLNQPTINYPNDIVRLKAEDAIREYKPNIVIGCWITEKIKGGITIGAIEGPDEDFIMAYPTVQKYIVVGNLRTHGNKALLKDKRYKSTILQPEWLYSRSLYKSDNCILIFEKL